MFFLLLYKLLLKENVGRIQFDEFVRWFGRNAGIYHEINS